MNGAVHRPPPAPGVASTIGRMSPARPPNPTPAASDLLRTGDDGRPRCWWCVGDAAYERYHDTEWAVPTVDDRDLFEKICLEGFQAGLSWLTILRKREAFREVFHNFDPPRVAAMTPRDVDRLLTDARIIRNRAKIEAAIHNARCAIDAAEQHGSLAALIWSHAPAEQAEPTWRSRADIPAATPESTALSKTLKRAGFRFVGPTTMYALMQAEGMVNDHVPGCCRRHAAATLQETVRVGPGQPR